MCFVHIQKLIFVLLSSFQIIVIIVCSSPNSGDISSVCFFYIIITIVAPSPNSLRKMGALFSKNWEQVPDETSAAATPVHSTPRNKLLLNLKVDPRSPIAGASFNRTPIRVTGDDAEAVIPQKWVVFAIKHIFDHRWACPSYLSNLSNYMKLNYFSGEFDHIKLRSTFKMFINRFQSNSLLIYS